MRRHQDPAADRIFATPQCPGSALTDDRDARRRHVVPSVEETTASELDPHCREVAGCRDLIAQRGIEARAFLGVWLSLENDPALPSRWVQAPTDADTRRL